MSKGKSFKLLGLMCEEGLSFFDDLGQRLAAATYNSYERSFLYLMAKYADDMALIVGSNNAITIPLQMDNIEKWAEKKICD